MNLNVNRRNKYLLKITLIVCVLISFSSCNNEDDIGEIFVNKTWYLSNYYITTNWNKPNNSKPVYSGDDKESYEIIKTINSAGQERFYITFFQETFTAKGITNTFSGIWEADGKNNTLRMTITSGSKPNGSTLEERTEREFFETISNLQYEGYYKGDNSNYLQIYQPDKKNYMQFSPIRR